MKKIEGKFYIYGLQYNYLVITKRLLRISIEVKKMIGEKMMIKLLRTISASKTINKADISEFYPAEFFVGGNL